MFQPDSRALPGSLVLPVCSDIPRVGGHTPSSAQHQTPEVLDKLPEPDAAKDLGLVLQSSRRGLYWN